MTEEKLLMLQCSSALASIMADFVEQKRALGNKYNTCVEVFNGFDRFCREQGMTVPAISRGLLAAWEERRSHENETTQALRISYVRALCRHMQNNGYDAPGAFHTAQKITRICTIYFFTR